MKFKKWLKAVDPITDVRIYTQEEEEPVFEGSMSDIPWYLLDYSIGTESNEKPIYIITYRNEHKIELPMIVINLIAK